MDSKTQADEQAQDAKGKVDPAVRREELVAEWKKVSEEAQAHAREAERLSRRATFIEGAIGMLNDLFGAPDTAPGKEAVVPRAERRRAAALLRQRPKPAAGGK